MNSLQSAADLPPNHAQYLQLPAAGNQLGSSWQLKSLQQGAAILSDWHYAVAGK